MLLDEIQAEFVRLQLHAVNLSVSASDDRFVVLHGSLLQYWKLRPVVGAQWLLGILQGLPDAAGPKAVMDSLSAAQANEAQRSKASDGGPALRLFDPADDERKSVGKRSENARSSNSSMVD